jgi:hypothetical protein
MEHPFDELSKALAGAMSRREALRRLGAGLVGAFLASLGLGGAGVQAAPPCPSGQIRCNDVCVDTKTDTQNCGHCGVVCPTGMQCINGKCGQGGGPCQAGQTRCKGRCVDLRSDVNNCGACGVVCGTGRVCSAGSCQASTCSDPHDCPESPTMFGCGGNPSCACAQMVDGTSRCTLCRGFCTDCTRDTDCPAGYVCAVVPWCCRDYPFQTACAEVGACS